MRMMMAMVAAAGAMAVGAGAPGARGAGEVRTTADIDKMIGEISPEKIHAHVERMAAFGTRHTLSATDSPVRGIGAARRWIHSTFEAIGEEAAAGAGAGGARQGATAVDVSFDTHIVEPDGRRIDKTVELMNVIAVLPGSMPEARERLIYVTGHYDSINGDVMDREADAPGANDDASGVAVLLEMARVMAGRTFDATIVFMATAGEEQGLIGARLHSRAAAEEGKHIQAVLNHDIVGDPAGQFAKDSPQAAKSRTTIRVFSQGVPPAPPAVQIAQIAMMGAESDSPSRQLARYIAEVARQHGTAIQPMLVFRNDRFLRGGDHTAFLEAGFPAAVRFTAMHEDYTRQHQHVREETNEEGETVPYGDLPRFVEGVFLANVARLSAATAAHLANAPSPPPEARIVAAALSTTTLLRWGACPEPDTAGYEVVWRATTSPSWEHGKDVGAVTEFELDLHKDNWLFGVRAYDRDGFRSPVAFPTVVRE